jgi:hypothetical protein
LREFRIQGPGIEAPGGGGTFSAQGAAILIIAREPLLLHGELLLLDRHLLRLLLLGHPINQPLPQRPLGTLNSVRVL